MLKRCLLLNKVLSLNTSKVYHLNCSLDTIINGLLVLIKEALLKGGLSTVEFHFGIRPKISQIDFTCNSILHPHSF